METFIEGANLWTIPVSLGPLERNLLFPVSLNIEKDVNIFHHFIFLKFPFFMIGLVFFLLKYNHCHLNIPFIKFLFFYSKISMNVLDYCISNIFQSFLFVISTNLTLAFHSCAKSFWKISKYFLLYLQIQVIFHPIFCFFPI